MNPVLTRINPPCYAGGVKKLSLLAALLVLFAALPLFAQDAEFYFERGVANFDKGDLDRAIGDWTEAIRLKPGYAEAYNNRGLAHYYYFELDRMMGLANRAKGELDRAIEDYSRAIALYPDYAEAWNNRGTAYQNKGELDRAIEDFTRAIALSENDVDAWNRRGNAYYAKRELDRAIEDYSKAIDLDPNIVGIWVNRGLAYRAKGELDRAIEDYSRAIALDPNDAATWYKRGLAYYRKGDFDRAIEDYSRVIALDQNNPYVWNNRGNAYEAKGELDLAIADYRKTIRAASISISNTLEIFFYSWHFAGFIYKTYPFLGGGIHENTANAQLAGFIREALSLSIAHAERIRSTRGVRGEQIMTGMLYQYYAGVDFEAVFGSVEKAFTYSESLRSRGFLEQMGTEAALKLQGVSETDKQKVQSLIREIDNLRDLFSKFIPQTDENTLMDGIYAPEYAEAGLALDKAEAELEDLDKDIAQRVPRYAELRNPKTATLAQAVSLCRDNNAILEYVIWDSDEESKKEFRAPSSPTVGQSNFSDWPAINSYCLVITKNGITPVRLEPGFDYAATIKALREKIFIKNEEDELNDESVFEAERNALYNALIKPVLEHLPRGIENLLIVPDSNLAFLPFDILRENNNRNTRSLGERYSITLSPSVSVSILAAQKDIALREPIIAFGGAWYEPRADRNTPDDNPYRRDENNDRLAALSKRIAEYGRRSAGETSREKADAVEYYQILGGWSYLGGSLAEIQGLQEIATIAPVIIQGKDVSKRRVKELSDSGALLKYPIVHFACHGFFDDNLTPQAALVFSEVSGLIKNESSENGYLSIEEIALLQLRARMVMLSACQTGLGNIRRGDGMSGLARAFMVAGSQNVGVSLWEINDVATAEFMWSVYRKVIREGKNFREAYREAKEEFRSSEEWSHPYYWAGFTMYE